ncbi:hypothetical protein J6TS2_25960 [Heyndrickxia sporothermodurans]|nr:hypothetical protein J6TS2_25960 [Heyndrickxia sporothermodurans]
MKKKLEAMLCEIIYKARKRVSKRPKKADSVRKRWVNALKEGDNARKRWVNALKKTVNVRKWRARS